MYIIFKFIASYITTYGAFFVFVAVFVYICRYVVRILVFPGSCIFIRKMVEYNNRKYMTKVIVTTVCNLRYTLEDTSHTPKITDDSAEMIMEEVAQVKKMIQSIITNNARQEQLGTLTQDQKNFLNRVQDLKQAIMSVRLVKSTDKMTNI